MSSKQRRQVSRNIENRDMGEATFSHLQAVDNFPDPLRPPKWFQLKKEVHYLRLMSKTLDGYANDIRQTFGELPPEYQRPELNAFADQFQELSELVLLVETPASYRKAGASLKNAMAQVETIFLGWITQTPEIEAAWNRVRQGHSPLSD
jgi:hypothetical protein